MRLYALALLAACQLSEEPVDEELSETTSAVTYSLGSGQSLEITTIANLDFRTSRIAACGNGVIYASLNDSSMKATVDGGVTWYDVAAATKGSKIACDRRWLFSLDSSGQLWRARTTTNGQLARHPTTNVVWSSSGLAVPAGTTDIQSGNGNIYALAVPATTGPSKLYASQLAQPTSSSGYVQGSAASWVLLASNLGSDRATGSGSLANFNAVSTSLPYKRMNRAFGANPDDTLYFNDTMLEGQNWWTSFPNGGENIGSISAEDSQTLYAVAQGSTIIAKKLVRYKFTEKNCTDGLDNDRNGLVDEEDPVCRISLAKTWCATNTGSFCIDRIQDSTNSLPNALVTCSGGLTTSIKPGICSKNIFSSSTDFISEPKIPEPANTGHYCSVIKTDGTWAFDYTGSDPCGELKTLYPTSTIVRSGIYSTTGKNNVYVRCNNGWYVPAVGQVGTAPLAEAYNAVGHTANRCVFTVSPHALAVFNAPFPTSTWASSVANGGRGYWLGHRFDHAPQCVVGDPGCPCAGEHCQMNLAWYGLETGYSEYVDNRGSGDNPSLKYQNAYDYGINEGTPLRALGYGKVIEVRYRPIHGGPANANDDCDSNPGANTGCGTPYQGEIYVQYDIGSDAQYRESFIGYYAHTSTMVVAPGQSVRPGQLLGYSGMIGSSSGPHLHLGVLRLTNTNAHTSSSEAIGHRVPFWITSGGAGVNWASIAGAVDPYGWRAPAENDPNAFKWGNAKYVNDQSVTGIGAWSPVLWPASETPPFPF